MMEDPDIQENAEISISPFFVKMRGFLLVGENED